MTVSDHVGTGFEIGGTINLGITVPGAKFSAEFGHDETYTSGSSIGVTTGVSVELDPGESVSLEIVAKRYQTKLRLDYDTKLNGGVAINYATPYQAEGHEKGHHFYYNGISEVMQGLDLSTRKKLSQDVKATFHTDATAVLKNIGTGKTQQILIQNEVPLKVHVVGAEM